MLIQTQSLKKYWFLRFNNLFHLLLIFEVKKLPYHSHPFATQALMFWNKYFFQIK